MALPPLELFAYIAYNEQGVAHLKIRQNRYLNDNFRDELKQVGSPARWNPAKLEWDCPLTAASTIVLKNIAEEYKVPIIWDESLQSFAQHYYDLESYESQVRLAIEKARNSDDQLPDYITNTYNNTLPPMRHQRLGYHWALRSTGLLLAWDPGLGKTRGAVDAAAGWYRHGIIRPMSNYDEKGNPYWTPEESYYTGEYKKSGVPRIKVVQVGHWNVHGGILVVCPKAVIRTWQREFLKWQGMNSVEITGTRQKKYKRAGMLAHAHIVNYESLNVVEHNSYDAIIVDESHRCANQSKQTARVLDMALKSKRKLLLTGTPVSNDLPSVFFQMLICDEGRSLGVSRPAFLDTYFSSHKEGPGEPKLYPKQNSIEVISSKMARCCYFLKKEDALDLPDKLHTPVFIEMENDQHRYYEALKNDAIAYIQDSTVTIDMAAQRIIKLMQVCQGIVKDDEGIWRHFNSVKHDALVEDLKDQLAGRKVVVWCRFTEEINLLGQRLDKEGIPWLRFDGQVKHAIRNRSIEAWNHDPNYKVFVAQLSMGEGIELVAEQCALPCYDTYYMALDYRYVNWKQTQDRVHRITQRFKCNYKYLLTPNGIDKKIYNTILAKDSTALTVHKTGKEFFLSLLTDDTPGLEAI